ncbi:RNA polymerase sigma factor [Candidatus Uhrbacteria bacterium]|nr:RNA polymerase sigma factor [Candidatus Uhrbacteria bacterium]
MSSLFDHYLLFRLRTKRDEQAYAELYDRYVSSIYRFVILKVSSKEIAEDITAETFLKCWQFIQTNQVITNFRALLYRVARNLVIDLYRKSGPYDAGNTVTFYPVQTSIQIEDDEQIHGFAFSDHARDQMRIEARTDLSLFLAQLGHLKEDYRDVLTLRLIEDLPFADIAKILEKSPGNTRVIYHRAMRALQDLNLNAEKKS